MNENESDYDDLAEYLACSGNKIGGYAEFIQSDHRSRDENGDLGFQLLQMEDEYIEFDDYTYVHLFIPYKDLCNLNFDSTYIHWDCD